MALGVGVGSFVACADDGSTSDDSNGTSAPDGAQILRSTSGALTAPSSAARADIVRGFLRGRGVAADQLQVAGERAGNGGVSHLRLEQTIAGLRVHGAYVKAAVNSRGELLQVIDRTVKAGPVASASITERDALAAAFAKLGYADATALHRQPTVERVAYADASGQLTAGFLVETWTAKTNQLDHTLVGSKGEIVSVESRTNTDRYNIFVEDPGKNAQTVVTGGIRPESPQGWLGAGAQTTHNIAGNNVHAYLDTDANNAPDTTTGGVSVANGDFLAAADLTQSPGTVSNRDVATQNLFYLNNITHDVLYSHGFNEAAGNFQTNNFGNGGAQNDPVNAEAQDGSGLDNANFATPTDGSSPRMQMFLWSGNSGNAFVTVGATDNAAFASTFGAAVSATGVTGALALAADSTAPTSDACEAIPAGSLTGRIAIVDRGTCAFTVKVLNAQKAGAIGVVIANNLPDGAFSPGGTDNKVKIPSAMVSLATGTTLKGQLGTSARLRSNPNPLRLDGDLDSDIVYHEYGHGLTWRMIGGMSGPMAGAIGEGASDTVSLFINGGDVVGEYSFANPAGIRRQPYATYAGSYKTSVTGTEVHNDGELYAAIMFRVKANYLAAGLAVTDVFQDWIQGMNFTPSTPAYENMRDGMLQAAPAARQCLIWEAYAHYGVGVGATGTVSRRGVVTVTESFTLPAACQ